MSRLNFVLVVVAVVCALLLVTSQHQARRLFNELELEQDKAKRLDVEWGQLQLEQSTWATPSRVEKLARERLHMVTPDARRTLVVQLPSAPAAGSPVAQPGAPAATGTAKAGERP